MRAKRDARATRKRGSAKFFGVRKARPRVRDGALQQANEHLVLEVLRSNAAEAELREVAEFRERLIGVIGHDLRSPLSAMLMGASLLASGGHLPEAEAELAGRIFSSGRRMMRILSALMDFTRARLGGGIEIRVTPMDLGSLCEHIASELRLATATKVNVNVRGDVAGAWDEGRLGEAISNVANNAVEHGDPHAAVDVDVSGAGDEVAIAITNRGPTIPPESMREMFEPFKQGPAARHPGHLGLGLFIAQQVVLAHGGTMTVESVREATTFTMRIPRTPRGDGPRDS